MKVEHFQPQSIFNGKINTKKQSLKLCDKKEVKRPDLRIDYTNLFAVCMGRNGLGETHCDTPPKGKGDKELCHIPNPSKGKPKDFSLKLSYTRNFSLASSDINVNKELIEVLNLNEQDLRKRRQGKWRGVARRIIKISGIKEWESGGEKVLPFAQQILDNYKKPNKNGRYFEFYDCIVYQLEKRIRMINNRLSRKG